MKSLLRFLAVASVIMLIGSIIIGTRVGSAKSEYLYSSIRGDRDDDRAERESQDRIENLHLMAKIPSVIYFGAAAAAFFLSSRNAGLTKNWRIGLQVMSVVCLGMLVWSSALSARVSMDEVFAAWVAAAVIIGGLSFMLMRRGSAPSAPQG